MSSFTEVPLDQLLYTVDDACKLLGVKRTTMFALLKNGTVPSVRIGRSRRIHRDAIVAFAETGTV
mgnify:FL=1